MAIVYRHRKETNLEVFYIGIGKSIKRAYNKDRGKRNNLWSKIVNKHNYIVEVVATDLTWEEACELEILMISEYGRINIETGTLCNMTDGGEGTIGLIRTEEHCKKISESKKGYKPSEETILKIKKARKHYITSEDTKLKISIAGKGRKVSKETRDKQSNALKGKQLGAKSKRAKLILDTQTGVFYYCIREAAEALNRDVDYMQRRLSGVCKNETSLIYA